MVFIPKAWKDKDPTTPWSAANAIDLETRLASYTDAQVAANLPGPSSFPSPADLPNPASLPLEIPGVGNSVAVSGTGDFIVRGVNCRPGTGGAWFGDQYSQSLVNSQLDDMVKYGFNTVRFNANYTDYAAAPASYTTNVNAALQAAVARNLRVIFLFLAWYTDLPTSSNLNSYYGMIDAIIGSGPWTQHPNILAWEPLQEIVSYPLAGDQLTLVQGLHNHVKGLDPNTLVTFNLQVGQEDSVRYGNAIPSIDPYVDFHSPHFYPDHSDIQMLNTKYAIDPIDCIRANTDKPILIEEAGVTLTTGDKPPIGTDERKAAFVRWVRRWAGAPGMMGACYWQMYDQSASQFGLFDGSGVAHPAAVEWNRLDARSSAAAVDVMERRSIPVMIDDFHRPTSSTSVGTSPLGGTPTAAGLTFGINSSHECYVASGTGSGTLVWDCHTGNVDIELEFISPTGAYNVGVVARYTDLSNYVQINFNAQHIYIKTRVGGTVTTAAQLSGPGPAAGISTSHRLKAKLRNNYVVAYEGDTPRIIATLSDSVLDATHTQHGIWVSAGTSPNDTGSLITHLAVGTPLRYGP